MPWKRATFKSNKVWVEVDGSLARYHGGVEPVIGISEAFCPLSVRVAKPRPCSRVLGVDGDRSLEQANRLFVVLPRVECVRLSTPQEEVVR